ncbi:MAG: signal peptidase II [Oscillospiraceae bacterium]
MGYDMLFVSIALIGILVGVDFFTKRLVLDNIPQGDVKSFLHIGSHDIISLTHIRNSGAAWSILEGKTLLLTALPIVVIGAALVYMCMGKLNRKAEYIAVSMVAAGGIGNLIDRIRYHEVVDFIRTDFIDFPIFNVADICVVCGTILLSILLIFFDGTKKADKTMEELSEKTDSLPSDGESGK